MNYRFETNAIRTQTERSNFLEHSTPLYITSSFIFKNYKIEIFYLITKNKVTTSSEYPILCY